MTTTELFLWARGWLDYLSFCVEAPMQAPMCRPFWYWVMVGSFAAGALAAGWVAWRLLDYRLKLRAAERAEAERQRVDVELIAERKWKGDDPVAGDLDDAEIERRIREEMDARRRKDAVARDANNMGII